MQSIRDQQAMIGLQLTTKKTQNQTDDSSQDLQESSTLQLVGIGAEEPGALGQSFNMMEQLRMNEQVNTGACRQREPRHVELKVAGSASRQKGLFKNMKRKYLKRVGDMFQVKFGNNASNMKPDSNTS